MKEFIYHLLKGLSYFIIPGLGLLIYPEQIDELIVMFMVFLCLIGFITIISSIYNFNDRLKNNKYPSFKGHKRKNIKLNTEFTIIGKWEFLTSMKSLCSPVAYSGNVYIGSYDQSLYAVDIETGLTKWKFNTNNNISLTPLVINDIIFVSSSINYDRFNDFNDNNIYKNNIYGNNKNYLYALNIENGFLLWKFNLNDEFVLLREFKDGLVFCGGNDKLFALDVNTGSLIWNFTEEEEDNWGAPLQPPEQKLYSSIIKHNNILYFSSNNILYALDFKSNQIIWEKYINGIFSSIYIFNDLLIFGYNGGLNDNNNYLTAINKLTGEQIWKEKTDAGRKLFFYEDFLYFITYDGMVCAVDNETGKERWKYNTKIKNSYSSNLTLFNKSILLARGTYLITIDAKSGIEDWYYNTGRELVNEPVVNGRLIIIQDKTKLSTMLFVKK